MPRWRNWQTRGTQNPVGLTPREGSTPSLGTEKLALEQLGHFRVDFTLQLNLTPH
jgi:hypothetical protein